MKKKLDLPTALQMRMSGSKVAVVLDTDIASLTLGIRMGLDDIGADFLAEVPDGEVRADHITTAAVETDEPALSPPLKPRHRPGVQ